METQLDRPTDAANAADATRETEQEVRALFEDYARAASALDVEGVLEHVADDVVLFDCPPPLQYLGKDAVRANWQKNVLDMFAGPVSYRFEQLDVRLRGDLACAHAILRFVGAAKDGAEMRANMRCTHVLEKRDGRWLIVHEHISSPIGYDGRGLMELDVDDVAR